MKFIAFVMESEGIEQARGIAERSLRVISFSNETDRLNLWTSYLNLEFHFGSEERVRSVFKKGCSSCDPKKLTLKLIDLYRRNQRWDTMVEVSRSLAQKHK
jgi:rRNA biogenesis protein RRP5